VTAIRIIPRADESSFPYDDAKRVLDALPNVRRTETDISAIIAAGIRARWPQHLIDSHRELLARGKCFDFEVDGGISCTLWEDNIFFRFFGAEHERCCLPAIEEMAHTLGCELLRQ
jgi:hypothetical protein